MNKVTKLGVSALCGSLAAVSAANAGDLTVTGGVDMSWVSQDNTAAFRITNDEFCHLLVTSFGLPIVSTSANISGNEIPNKFSEISKEIRKNVDYIVNLRHNELMTTPSTIIMINEDGKVKKIR